MLFIFYVVVIGQSLLNDGPHDFSYFVVYHIINLDIVMWTLTISRGPWKCNVYFDIVMWTLIFCEVDFVIMMFIWYCHLDFAIVIWTLIWWCRPWYFVMWTLILWCLLFDGPWWLLCGPCYYVVYHMMNLEIVMWTLIFCHVDLDIVMVFVWETKFGICIW